MALLDVVVAWAAFLLQRFQLMSYSFAIDFLWPPSISPGSQELGYIAFDLPLSGLDQVLTMTFASLAFIVLFLFAYVRFTAEAKKVCRKRLSSAHSLFN